MVKRLRRTLISSYFLLTAATLVVLLGISYWSAAAGYEAASTRVLEHEMAQWAPGSFSKRPLPAFARKPAMTPYQYPSRMLGVVSVSADGVAWTWLKEPEKEIPEMGLMLVAAIGAERPYGHLVQYHFRYFRLEDGESCYVALVDAWAEEQELRTTGRRYLLVGLVGLAAFFGISVVLSGYAVKPVAKSQAQQQQLISDVSHELKNPLAVIMTNLSILRDEIPPDADHARWIASATEEVARINRLVTQLLFLSQAECAWTRGAVQTFSLTETLQSCALTFETIAHEAGKTLWSEIDQGLCMEGDPEQIRQLIVILLDNAVKYAEPGEIIRLEGRCHGGTTSISVANTGPAIDRERLPHLFERFYRGEDQKKTDGFGLGLAIAKQIVDNHGGTITVASDQETVFTVEL